MNVLFQIVFVLITASFFVFGSLITTHWAKTDQVWLWIPVFVSASMGYILFGYLIKNTNLSISAGLVDATILIVSILIGIFVFKDVVTTRQAIGLVLASLSLLLVL